RREELGHLLDDEALAGARRPLRDDGDGPAEYAGGECEVDALREAIFADQPAADDDDKEGAQDVRAARQLGRLHGCRSAWGDRHHRVGRLLLFEPRPRGIDGGLAESYRV